MDYSKDYNSLEPVDDLCESCEEVDYQIQYWWKEGEQGEPTGDLECPNCGHVLKGEANI